MAHTRKRAGATVLGLSAIAAIALVPATPAQADPDIKDVKATVDRLYHEAEAAQERLHDAKLDLADLKSDLAGLKADQSRQDERLAEVSFGNWEGFTTEELRQRWPDALAARERDKWGFMPPQAQAPVAGAARRIVDGLNDVALAKVLLG